MSHQDSPFRMSKVTFKSKIVVYQPPSKSVDDSEIRKSASNFKFITSNDLDGFKGVDIKRNVRSYVMANYRKKQRDSKSALRKVQEKQKLPQSNPKELTSLRKQPKSAVPSRRLSTSLASLLHEDIIRNIQGAWQLLSVPDDEVDEAGNIKERSPDYTDPDSRVFLTTYIDEMYAKYESFHGPRCLSSAVDPFESMPRYTSGVDAQALRHHCVVAWCCPKFVEIVVPVLFRSRYIYLTSLCIASSHLDIVHGYADDSYRTTLVKTEAMHYVNEQINLEKPTTEDAFVLLMSMILLLMAEAGDDHLCQLHEDGIVRLIQRGECLSSLGTGTFAAFFYQIIQVSAIYREGRPSRVFDKIAKGYSEHDIACHSGPESPLFCPFGYLKLAKKSLCSQQLLDVLYLMRDLSDICVNQYPCWTAKTDSECITEDLAIISYPQETLTRIYLIRDIVLRLPSASDPSSQVYQDWKYECCRIAALIYTIAIYHRVPFSQVDTVYNNSYRSMFKDAHGQFVAETTSLASALRKAHMKAGVGGLWGADLDALLLWTCLIGIVASKYSPEFKESSSEAYAEAKLTRRWHSMLVLRLLSPVGCTYPSSTITMLNRFLDVIEYVGSAGSHQLPSPAASG